MTDKGQSAIEHTRSRISGKWKCVTIFALLQRQVCRFLELK